MTGCLAIAAIVYDLGGSWGLSVRGWVRGFGYAVLAVVLVSLLLVSLAAHVDHHASAVVWLALAPVFLFGWVLQNAGWVDAPAASARQVAPAFRRTLFQRPPPASR